MATNYAALNKDPERFERIAENGARLLSELYAGQTQFLFELLQNAEDAMARREGWQGKRSVSFQLKSNEFSISHFGTPFNTADVSSICDIGATTKGLTDIGRFGIGFKSVYAFTDRPEIHSGDESFAIERYISPVAVPAIQREADETLIIIPLKASSESDHDKIATGLQCLGACTLLFLRQIESINWSVAGGHFGVYTRKSYQEDACVRRVILQGLEGSNEIVETWLVFSRQVISDKGLAIGDVEIAFSITKDADSQLAIIQQVEHSTLVAFFPTEHDTHLGFLAQGPYRTTPSRDNVPHDDAWNQLLVFETASLLVEALRWLRDHNLLDTTALQCLPLDRTKFTEGIMFAPLFEAVRDTLSSESLLPRFGGGCIKASAAKLASTQGIRGLFDTTQLAMLFEADEELAWLSEDITRARSPILRHYLMNELDIAEVEPESILPKLTLEFLQLQSDEWIVRLYAFLYSQPALLQAGRLTNVPLIRLEDGNHVAAMKDGRPQAFLPSAISTGFPTVSRAVCATNDVRIFLTELGLTEPDLVDDVVRYVLPRYEHETDLPNDEYESDIQRILKAFSTDSNDQRGKLLKTLRDSYFVMSINAGDGTVWITKPNDVYLATNKIKALFAGVPKVYIVDDSYECMRGEKVRELLEACGATRYLKLEHSNSMRSAVGAC